MSTLRLPEYVLDAGGRRTMRGLTYEETTEFERLDASRPFAGKIVWMDGLSEPPSDEIRWLDLWAKHRRATQPGNR